MKEYLKNAALGGFILATLFLSLRLLCGVILLARAASLSPEVRTVLMEVLKVIL